MLCLLEKPSTPLSEHSEKSKKYDRQLRLWGEHGQASLETSHVCLINACATGLEILKSLVLPGVGAITIVDDVKVTSKDLGNNFFVDHGTIGRLRGEVALQNLLELNSDVSGCFVDESLEDILTQRPFFFESFSVVVGCNLIEKSLLQLSSLLWSLGKPLVVARSYGMIGYIRLQFNEHYVIESHPDNTIPDLRLDRPFPSLIQYKETYNLDTMNDKDRCHVPYGVLLLKYLDAWKTIHGDVPKTYNQKEDFKQFLKKHMRDNKDSELNFEEAIKAVNVTIGTSQIPCDVEKILDEASNLSPSPSSNIFWLLAKALHEFVASEGNGLLPVSGIIPDMTADSTNFIQMQNIYREQAASDADWVYRRVQEICHQIESLPLQITENEVKSFCKNAAFLRVLQGDCIANEYERMINLADYGYSQEYPDGEIVWYVMLRAVDQFYKQYRSYPGYFTNQVETDISNLKIFVNKLLSDWSCYPCIKDEYVHEMCRYGAAELHSIASYVGGCASQEIIKLLTKQYVPINNTFIYNGATSCSSTFSL